MITTQTEPEMETRTCKGPGMFGKGCTKTFRITKTSPDDRCGDECRDKDMSLDARVRRGLRHAVGGVFAKKPEHMASAATKALRMSEAMERAARRTKFELDAASAVTQEPDPAVAPVVGYIESGQAQADQAKIEAEQARPDPYSNAVPVEDARKAETDTIAEMERRWKRYVEEAKPFVVNICNFRNEVARIALKACQIHYGGGDHWKNFDGVFTVKRFAEEVGVNPKTLSGWIATYRNVIQRLPAGVYSEEHYDAARRVRNATNRNTPATEVGARFIVEAHSSRDRYYLVQGIKRFRTLHYLITQKVTDFNALAAEAPDEICLLERLCEETLTKLRDFRAANKP